MLSKKINNQGLLCLSKFLKPYKLNLFFVFIALSFSALSMLAIGLAIRFLIDNGFNFCVVTNTSKESVDIFKHKIPLLNDIKQWIYRDDYVLPKPYSECYELAKKKYHKNEKYVIGIEDSTVGYNALKGCTELIYIYNNEYIFNKKDCYLFDNFNLLYI